MFRLRFAGSVPKEAEYPESNEDRSFYSLESGRIAISDGASESFDSKNWADLLVSSYVRSPEFNRNWLGDCLASYGTLYDKQKLSWSMLAAFERGSFATLLGITFDEVNESIEIFAIGDSSVFVFSQNEKPFTFPYTTSEQYKGKPELLCTNNMHNTFIDSGEFYREHTASLHQSQGATVILATDALSCWLMEGIEINDERWKKLLDVNSEEYFTCFVRESRKSGKLKIDDTTLIIFDLLESTDVV